MRILKCTLVVSGMASNWLSKWYKNYNFCGVSTTLCLDRDLGMLTRCVFTGPSMASAGRFGRVTCGVPLAEDASNFPLNVSH